MQSPDIGEFIKGLRENARISLRQLAEQAGVSNPYLSQIERGLRKPSAEVLAQIAGALRVSTPAMYLKAGLLGHDDSQGVLTAIAADPLLTVAQKQSLTQIYETFVRESSRDDQPGSEPKAAPHRREPAPPQAAAKKALKKAAKPTAATPDEAAKPAKAVPAAKGGAAEKPFRTATPKTAGTPTPERAQEVQP